MTRKTIFFLKSHTALIIISLAILFLPCMTLNMYADSKDISDCTLTGIENMDYTGERVRLNIIVSHNSVKLTKGRDYKLVYRNNIYPGTATVTIQGMGSYQGEVVRNFEIKPCEVRIVGATLSGVEKNKHGEYKIGELELGWYRLVYINKDVHGYQIHYSIGEKGIKKLRTVEGDKAFSVFKNLEKDSIYSFKIRAYRIVEDIKIFGSYSETFSINLEQDITQSMIDSKFTYEYNRKGNLYVYLNAHSYNSSQNEFRPDHRIDEFGLDSGVKYVKNQLIVRTKIANEISFDQAKEIFDSYGAYIVGYREIFSSSHYQIEFKEPKNNEQLKELIEKIKKEPNVLSASFNYIPGPDDD